MAVDTFLKLDKIDGESKDAKHAKEIELMSWSWGANNPTSIGSATGGAGAGKAHFHELSVMKTVDSASPKILTSLVSGQHFATAKLTVRKAGGDAKASGQEYLTIELKTVFVTSYQLSGSSEAPMESVSFAVGAYNMLYSPQKDDGTLGTAIPSSWSQITNTAKV